MGINCISKFLEKIHELIPNAFISTYIIFIIKMDKILRIGIVANTAFNIYNFRLGLIKTLQNKGYQVIAIAPADDYVAMLKEQQIDFVALKQLSRKGTNPIHDLRLCIELRKIYKQQQLDAVLQYTIKPNIYGTLAAKIVGVKAICTVTGLGYTFLNKGITSTIAHQLYKTAFSFAHKVLFQNTDDEQLFLQQKLVDKTKTIVVPGSGIDTQKFHPEYCTNKTNDSILRFLMIARFLKDKGIYEYVDAARQILQENKKVAFHLLGDIDPDNPSSIRKEELDQWIQSGIIHYDGYTKDTRPFICASDCVVLPSYREGMPRVILEGLAMGKPCITTDAPGCKNSVEEEISGFICKTADAKSLKTSMEKFLLLDASKRMAMGVNARKRAENIFSEKIVFQTYLDLLQKIRYS